MRREKTRNTTAAETEAELTAISRTRALTYAESLRLESAIKQQGKMAQRGRASC